MSVTVNNDKGTKGIEGLHGEGVTIKKREVKNEKGLDGVIYILSNIIHLLLPLCRGFKCSVGISV